MFVNMLNSTFSPCLKELSSHFDSSGDLCLDGINWWEGGLQTRQSLAVSNESPLTPVDSTGATDETSSTEAGPHKT